MWSIRGERKLLTLEIDPIEKEMVITIFEKTVKDGYGSYVMAQYVNDRKMLTHNGAKFQSNTIKRILQNPIYCGYYNRGGVTSKRVKELQIIDDAVFDEAQKILEQRKYTNEKKTQLARTAKSSTMLCGNIYYAHCGKKLCANSFVDRYTTKDGTSYDGGRRFRYLCSGKAMKRNECDGQSVYSAAKVDEIVLDALHQCFDKIKVTPKDAAIEKKYRTQISLIKSEIKRLNKEIEILKRKLGELTGEIANSLLGDSKFTPNVLSMAIETTKGKIADNVQRIAEKQNQLNDKETDMRMIICKLFKEILVGKGYSVQILMDSSYEQFLI